MTDGSPTTFSEALKAATWSAHSTAEHSPYMEALLGGRLTVEGYAELLVQSHAVYEVLEEAAARMAEDPLAGSFVSPNLTRVPSLEADLGFLLGSAWRSTTSPSPATRRYVDRLREICFDWPGGFVAHHYTRYMGDLSGGQVIGRLVERAYSFDDGRGVEFYAFPGIEKPKVFKDRYRASLDAATWDADEQRRVIDEVLVAYRLNTELLADLGTSMERFLRPAVEQPDDVPAQREGVGSPSSTSPQR
jgi:heme oxygenase